MGCAPRRATAVVAVTTGLSLHEAEGWYLLTEWQKVNATSVPPDDCFIARGKFSSQLLEALIWMSAFYMLYSRDIFYTLVL